MKHLPVLSHRRPPLLTQSCLLSCQLGPLGAFIFGLFMLMWQHFQPLQPIKSKLSISNISCILPSPEVSKGHHSHHGLFAEHLRSGEARALAFCGALSWGCFEWLCIAQCTIPWGTLTAEILVDLYLQENHFVADDVCQMVSSKVSEGKMPFLTCTKVLWGVAPPPVFWFFFFKEPVPE